MNVKGHYPYEVPQGTIIKHQPCSRSFGNYLKTIKLGVANIVRWGDLDYVDGNYQLVGFYFVLTGVCERLTRCLIGWLTFCVHIVNCLLKLINAHVVFFVDFKFRQQDFP